MIIVTESISSNEDYECTVTNICNIYSEFYYYLITWCKTKIKQKKWIVMNSMNVHTIYVIPHFPIFTTQSVNFSNPLPFTTDITKSFPSPVLAIFNFTLGILDQYFPQAGISIKLLSSEKLPSYHVVKMLVIMNVAWYSTHMYRMMLTQWFR